MDSDTEQHLAACEARWCIKQDSSARQAYYALVMEKLGKESANRLIADVNALRRSASSPSTS